MKINGLLGAAALFGLLLIVVSAGGGALAASYADTPARDATVQNETVTVDYGSSQFVENSDAEQLYDNETVYNSQGEPLTEGTDYDFNSGTGALTFHSTSNTTENATASITYSYRAKPDLVRGMHNMQVAVMSALPYLLLVFVPIGLMGVAGAMAYISKKGGFAGGMGR